MPSLVSEPSEDAHANAASLRSIQRCLWDVLSEQLKEAERDEVKRAIGTLLVDENRALFDEATALAEILGDVQLKTSALLQRRQLCSNPERNMIESDIQLVMDRLRSVVGTALFAGSAARERQLEDVVPKASAQDKAVYEYIQTSTTQNSGSVRMRPSTASSRPPTASTLSRPSTASSSTTTTTTLTDPSTLVANMQGKLSVFSIDEVKETLQCALQEERTCLLNDIEYLTALLTDETDMQHHAAAPPPSLTELKQYSTKLKKLLESEESRVQHELTVSRMFNAAQTEGGRPGRLRRMVSASRESLPTAAAPPPAATSKRLGSPGSSDAMMPPVRPPSAHGAMGVRPRSSTSGPSPVPVPDSNPGQGSRPGSGQAPHRTPDESASRGQSASSTSSLTRGHDLAAGTTSSNLWHPGVSTSPALKRTLSSHSTRAHTPPSATTTPPDTLAKPISPPCTLVKHDSLTSQPHPAVPAALRQPTCHNRQPEPEPLQRGHEHMGHRQGVRAEGGSPGQLVSGHQSSRSAQQRLGSDLIDAQVDTLKGGVAAILARHNYTPSTS